MSVEMVTPAASADPLAGVMPGDPPVPPPVDGPLCAVRLHPTGSSVAFACTRECGHPGQHISSGTELVWATWPPTGDVRVAAGLESVAELERRASAYEPGVVERQLRFWRWVQSHHLPTPVSVEPLAGIVLLAGVQDFAWYHSRLGDPSVFVEVTSVSPQWTTLRAMSVGTLFDGSRIELQITAKAPHLQAHPSRPSSLDEVRGLLNPIASDTVVDPAGSGVSR